VVYVEKRSDGTAGISRRKTWLAHPGCHRFAIQFERPTAGCGREVLNVRFGSRLCENSRRLKKTVDAPRTWRAYVRYFCLFDFEIESIASTRIAFRVFTRPRSEGEVSPRARCVNSVAGHARNIFCPASFDARSANRALPWSTCAATGCAGYVGGRVCSGSIHYIKRHQAGSCCRGGGLRRRRTTGAFQTRYRSSLAALEIFPGSLH